jgi:hypothetical protein
MTTISIERLVSSFNNESMVLDSTYNDIKDLVCELPIKEKEFKSCYIELKQNYIINGDVEQVLPSSKSEGKEITYEDEIKNAPDDKSKEMIREVFIKKYIKQNYFSGLLFGNNFRKIAGERKNTLFIFPTFNTSSKGLEKLNTLVDSYYRWIFSLNDFERFYLTNDKTNDTVKALPPYRELQTLPQPKDSFPNNAFAFLPVFTDATSESNEEFKQRMEVAFDVILDGIKKEARYADGQVVISNNVKIPFTNICFMVDNDKDKNLFTGYYSSTKLSKEKSTILNDLMRNFIQKKSIDTQSVRLPDVSPDPMKKINKDYISKDFSTIARRIGMALTNSFYTDKLSKLNLFIDKINDTYKKTVDKAYAKLATAQSNISFMRLYYRVNNIDKTEDNIIKTGNDFLYRLTGVILNDDDDDADCNTVYICKMYEVTGRKNRYRVEIHKNETREYRKVDKGFCKSGKQESTGSIDDVELEEDTSEGTSKYHQAMIEIKKVYGIYRFKKVDNTQSFNYPGTLTFFRDLHTNERYKWFKHNDINGSLSQEMQIKFYNNILFDKKSLIEYLKSMKKYNEKNPNLGSEFLKINEDIKLLMGYSDFIYNDPKFNKTHINEPSLLLKSLPFNQNAFLEKIKDSILDIIFQPNQIIYIGGAKKSTTEKKDTSNNYKVIGFTRYKTDINSIITQNKKKLGSDININDSTTDEVIKSIFPLMFSHLSNISHGDESEVRYCPHRKINKCEVIRDELKPFEERMIAVVDITRDVHDASELKEKAKCKRLRKSIKLRLKRLIEPIRLDKFVLGQVIGGKSKIEGKRYKTKKIRRIHR